MNIRIVGFLACVSASSYCAAINVGDITSIIPSNETMLARDVANTTDVARFVGLKISRISSPMADGKVIPMESSAEILSTPSNLVLPGSAKDIFKIMYQGPADNKERYYRLSWIDAPVTNSGKIEKDKGAQATTSAQINTILVVAPREEKFDYKYANGTITNTGNTSFRIVSAGPCTDKSKDIDNKGCRERYYVMPNMSLTLKYTNTHADQTHVGIWHNDKYTNVVVAK